MQEAAVQKARRLAKNALRYGNWTAVMAIARTATETHDPCSTKCRVLGGARRLDRIDIENFKAIRKPRDSMYRWAGDPES